MRLFITLALLATFTPSLCADDKTKDGFVPIFNGKDLKGWKNHAESKAKWEVVDGCITASGPASHLFTERGDFADFIYRVEAKINEGGNSGQYFRAQFASSWPKGYEAQINATHKDVIKTGSLYPAFNPKLTQEQKDKIIIKDCPHKVNEWFTQEVTAEGNHIIIKVNGKVTVDFTDDAKTFSKGHFAIQHHDPGCKIMIRKAEVKELGTK